MRPSVVLSLMLACAVAVLCQRADAGPKVDVARLGFTFALPDGFENPAADAGDAPAALRFRRGRPGDGSFGILEVVPMAGTIGPGKLNRPIVEESARAALRAANATATDFDYRTTRWKTFDLELVVAHVSKGSQRLVTLTTQVPLARQAVQLHLLGPAADEANLIGELQSVLGSLDGQSSWLTDAERSARLGRMVGFLVGGLVVLAAAVVVRRHRQGARPGGGT
jgi:hypothetical protein